MLFWGLGARVWDVRFDLAGFGVQGEALGFGLWALRARGSRSMLLGLTSRR